MRWGRCCAGRSARWRVALLICGCRPRLIVRRGRDPAVGHRVYRFDLECSPFPRLCFMRYRTIGSEPSTRRDVSVLSLGAMLMGSRTDEATSLAILDRFVEAGGTFIDTSGNYA